MFLHAQVVLFLVSGTSASRLLNPLDSSSVWPSPCFLGRFPDSLWTFHTLSFGLRCCSRRESLLRKWILRPLSGCQDEWVYRTLEIIYLRTLTVSTVDVSWGRRQSSGFYPWLSQGNDLLGAIYPLLVLSPISSCRNFSRWISPCLQPIPLSGIGIFLGKVFEVREPLEEWRHLWSINSFGACHTSFNHHCDTA